MPKPNKKNLLFYYTFVYVKVRIHIALCCAYTNLHLGRRSCTRQTLKQNEKKKMVIGTAFQRLCYHYAYVW